MRRDKNLPGHAHVCYIYLSQSGEAHVWPLFSIRNNGTQPSFILSRSAKITALLLDVVL